MWTQAWRRLNKKGKDDGIARKRVRKVAKVQRAIVGASLEDVSYLLWSYFLVCDLIFIILNCLVAEEEADHKEGYCFWCRR